MSYAFATATATATFMMCVCAGVSERTHIFLSTRTFGHDFEPFYLSVCPSPCPHPHSDPNSNPRTASHSLVSVLPTANGVFTFTATWTKPKLLLFRPLLWHRRRPRTRPTRWKRYPRTTCPALWGREGTHTALVGGECRSGMGSRSGAGVSAEGRRIRAAHGQSGGRGNARRRFA